MSSDQRFQQAAEEMGYSFDGEIKVGGNYLPLVRHEQQIYISGQIPRVGDSVVVTGRVGEQVSLEQAQLGARISVMRALALLQRSLGSLESIKGILRIGVYVQCSMDFTRQSEVADAASDLLVSVLGEIGAHTRTSVGVYQLPKNASVEVELIAVAGA